MLRQNQRQVTRSLPYSSPLPFSCHPTEPSKIPTQIAPIEIKTDSPDILTETPRLKIAQLNCFNRQAVVENLLADNTYDVLVLQEP